VPNRRNAAVNSVAAREWLIPLIRTSGHIPGRELVWMDERPMPRQQMIAQAGLPTFLKLVFWGASAQASETSEPVGAGSPAPRHLWGALNQCRIEDRDAIDRIKLINLVRNCLPQPPWSINGHPATRRPRLLGPRPRRGHGAVPERA
jgi:hypothetical protein